MYKACELTCHKCTSKDEVEKKTLSLRGKNNHEKIIENKKIWREKKHNNKYPQFETDL